jgi:YihY family inner membrane protein
MRSRSKARPRAGSRRRRGVARAENGAGRAALRVHRVLDHVERRLPGVFGRAVEQARHGDDLLLFSASLAFYALVSLIPMVLMVVWITSLVLGDDRVNRLSQEVSELTPKALGAGELITRVAELGNRLGVTAVIASVWPATSYGAALTRAFDRLSSGPDRELKGLRGRWLTLVALLPLLVAGTLVATFVGSQALGEGWAARVAAGGIALAAGFLMAGGAVAIVYWIFPDRPLGPRGIAEATLVTATGVSILSVAFVLYLSLGANFEEHYATSGVAGIVLLGLWLFLSNALLLLGYKVGANR